jgi:hypothetical protein
VAAAAAGQLRHPCNVKVGVHMLLEPLCLHLQSCRWCTWRQLYVLQVCPVLCAALKVERPAPVAPGGVRVCVRVCAGVCACVCVRMAGGSSGRNG